MNRLKFLLFAAVAIGLWGAWLSMLSGGISARAIESASVAAKAAPRAVMLKLESVRERAVSATLKVAASTAARQKAGKPEAPSAERVKAARDAAAEVLGEAFKGRMMVGAVNDLGSLVALGDADPGPAPAGLDVRAAADSGSAGGGQTIEGAAWLFYSTPVMTIEKADLAPVGQLFVGVPLNLEAATLDQLAKDLNLVAVGLVTGGSLGAVGGLDKKALESLLKSAKPGDVELLNLGSVSELGPVKFPIMTANDAMGGKAALAVGFRRDVSGTPFEVLTVASTRGLMTALAELQRFSLMALLGLLVLAIGVMLFISEAPPEDEAPAVVAPQLGRPATIPPPMAAAAQPSSQADASSSPGAVAISAPSPFADGPLGAEASPDDFQFGNESAPAPVSAPPVSDLGVAEPMMGGMTEGNPYPGPPPPSMPDPFAELNALQPQTGFGTDYSSDERERTVAYPVASPFAAAGASNPSAAGHTDPGFNPDTTRVAMVPKELLKASQRISQEVTAVNPRMAPAMPRVSPSIGAANAATSDETHWQDVFAQFVALREKCGEPADGLTYEKFSAKLRKNKEQLVAKYNCRTVRFQVHAKDGKAALKATPVRD